MSEYTDYYLVQAAPPAEARRALEGAGVRAIVLDEPGPPDQGWTAVALPFPAEDAEALRDLFDCTLFFHLDEDWKTWRLDASPRGGREMQFLFSDRVWGDHANPARDPAILARSQNLSDADIDALAACLDVDSEAIRPHLRIGGHEGFLAAIVAPYYHMLDQNLLERWWERQAAKNGGGVVTLRPTPDL